mmetsp:Transcript_19448/g.54197  ORF Transcript_19448/g.54197 Transcript_19448/m.54197 type:complete len:363 (-) Transcript_19448:3439-4527(-)
MRWKEIVSSAPIRSALLPTPAAPHQWIGDRPGSLPTDGLQHGDSPQVFGPTLFEGPARARMHRRPIHRRDGEVPDLRIGQQTRLQGQAPICLGERDATRDLDPLSKPLQHRPRDRILRQHRGQRQHGQRHGNGTRRLRDCSPRLWVDLPHRDLQVRHRHRGAPPGPQNRPVRPRGTERTGRAARPDQTGRPLPSIRRLHERYRDKVKDCGQRLQDRGPVLSVGGPPPTGPLWVFVFLRSRWRNLSLEGRERQHLGGCPSGAGLLREGRRHRILCGGRGLRSRGRRTPRSCRHGDGGAHRGGCRRTVAGLAVALAAVRTPPIRPAAFHSNQNTDREDVNPKIQENKTPRRVLLELWKRSHLFS